MIQLNATVAHKASAVLQLRNQSAFTWVNTSVRQTSGAAVGVLGPNGRGTYDHYGLKSPRLF